MSSVLATRDRILDAALASLQAGTLTMADAAARAGVSRQAVYLHFADREALLAALSERFDPAGAARLAAIASAPSARAGLVALIGWQAEHYPPLALLAAAGSGKDNGRLACCRALAARFRDEGRLSPHLSADAAADLLWSLTGIGVWRDLDARGWNAGRYRDHLTFLAVSALTK